jgi:hypothetical protein
MRMVHVWPTPGIPNTGRSARLRLRELQAATEGRRSDALGQRKMDSSKEELMTKTRTLGIAVLADGTRFIDKPHLGVRIGLRVGAITQEQAEE